jgi:hypothetical protein
MEAQAYTGIWWLPETPEKQLSGTLEISDTGKSTLRLVGTLAPIETMAEVHRYPVLLGFSDTGRLITLVEAATGGFTIHAPGIPTQAIVPVLAIVGAHFASPEEVVATTTYADFTFLTEWIGPGAITESRGIDGIQFRYTKPVFPSVAVGDQTITISPGYKVTGDGIRARALRASYSLRIEGASPLEWIIRERVRPFQNLLTLGVHEPNVVTRVAFKSDRGTRHRDDAAISAIFEIAEPPTPNRKPTTHNMLFAYHHIEPDFAQLVSGWYQVHSELEDVCNLFFTTLEKGGPLEVQFLNLVRAVEVYDRLRAGNHVLPRADHRRRLRAIYEGVPKDSLGWVKEKLAYSNEPTLRVRLARLLGQVREVMEPIVGDLDAFAKLVGDTRNYYTHYDPASEARAASGITLYRTCQRLQVLIGALLLHAAKLDPAALNALFHANQQYLFLRRVHMGVEEG